MAALQLRNGTYRLFFQYNGKQYTSSIGEVSRTEALQAKARTEQLLMRLKQNLLEIPDGVSVVEFIQYDGKPPTPAQKEVQATKATTLNELRTAYVNVFSNGAIEANTLGTAKIHLTHLEETYGRSFVLCGLTLGKLQKHIDRRQATVTVVTIKKEMDTFRAVWRWGDRMKLVSGPFPAAGLVYPKTDDKLPFMGWTEIARRIKAGGDPETLWECVYLTTGQIAEFLTYTKGVKNVPAWVYPMCATAAHTAMRRSELMRCRLEDVDLDNAIITVREKKKARGTLTTRRVPISDFLASVLKTQMEAQAGKVYLFGDGFTEISDPYAYKMFVKLVKGSKWEVLPGYHCFRHSWISLMASKGTDQRIIDDVVGHCTEQQRRRYRHLFPNVTQKALKAVFG